MEIQKVVANIILTLILCGVVTSPNQLQGEVNSRDLDLLSACMQLENGNNGDRCLLLTGSVVLNRRDYVSWCPNTVEGVLYQKHPIQYSTTSKFFTEDIPQECYDMATELLIYGAPEVPKNVVYQATFKQGSGEWKRLNGESFCYE